ncbi:MAG TPA: DUF4037 domain-containing protein [Propionibacteriaceae bacterium]|nr:DUF4037 domain-containing protein [Propionibacteriaceae bacterium]
MPAFTPGLELSRQLYRETVAPVLEAAFPDLVYSAAVMGRGSEVLGFDDEMSRDHNWEPRVSIFVGAKDLAGRGEAIAAAVRGRLPATFRGHPTQFEVVTSRGYFLDHLGLDIDGEIAARDWLTISEQQLNMFTTGAVFHDDLGLQAVRDRLAYYPHDVWLYLLVAGWWRVHPEVNLVGRAGFVGDEMGSALIGSQLVQGLMRLCFLMEKQYAPYAKWFGTAFSRLRCAAELSPSLWSALRADSWPERESALNAAYAVVAAMHNALGITPPVAVEVQQLWNRPFGVIWGDFPGALAAQIRDPDVKRIAAEWPTGGIDQLRDTLWHPRHRGLLLRMFE